MMIETMKTVVDLTCIVIHYGLYLSFEIGQFLVNGISFLQHNLLKFLYLLLDIFGVILESFTTFYQDVGQNSQNILRTISSVDIITYFSDIGRIVQFFIFMVSTLSDLVEKLYISFVMGIQTVSLTPKHLVLYIIKSICNFVAATEDIFYNFSAFLSETSYSLSQQVKDLFMTSLLFCCNLPMLIMDFILNIALEFIITTTVCFALIYLILRLQVGVITYFAVRLELMFWKFWDKFKEFQTWFHRQFARNTSLERVVYRRQVLPTRRPQVRPKISSNDKENDLYCIVCQEHLKCVLLLPCRHLCMCNECADTLQTYHNACPICRSDIERTMQVFV